MAKTKKVQRGGSGNASSRHSGKSNKNYNYNDNDNLETRLVNLKLPEVPDTHTTPIPKKYTFPNIDYYIDNIIRKRIPSRNQIDINTEQTILYNLLKLKNFKYEFSSLNTLFACVDLIINLINDKITNLSKLMPEPRASRMSYSVSNTNAKVIRGWIDFFINLRTFLIKERTRIQSLLK